MASTQHLKPCLSTSELCLFSSSKSKIPSLPFLSFFHPKPINISISLSLKNKNPSFTPFVAQTSDWAQQQQEEENQAVDDNDEVEEEDGQSTDASLSEWEGDGESGTGGATEAEGGSGDFAEVDSYPEPPEEAKLFVGNLPYDIESEALAGLFDKAGVVEIAEVIFSRETGQSRGFGFVTMSTVEEADKAVEMFNRYDINGRLLTVNKAAPRGARVERAPREFEPSFRIYVGNLPWQIDDSRLEQVFSEHGKVVNARVVYDRETGRSRGFGFVTMSSQTELDDAIAALDGQSLDGRAIRVNVAEERSQRGSF